MLFVLGYFRVTSDKWKLANFGLLFTCCWHDFRKIWLHCQWDQGQRSYTSLLYGIHLYSQQWAENKEMKKKKKISCQKVPNTCTYVYTQYDTISDPTPCNRIKTVIHCWSERIIWYMIDMLQIYTNMLNKFPSHKKYLNMQTLYQSLTQIANAV